MTSKELKDQLENDILDLLKNIENQPKWEKIQTIRNMVSKHIHMNTSDHLMDHYDLQSIIEGAGKLYVDNHFKFVLGSAKKKVEERDYSNLCVIESTVSHLNKLGCLKKMPRFDKREDKI